MHQGEHVGVLMPSRPSAVVAVAALNRIGADAVLLRVGAEVEREAALGSATRVVCDPERVSEARGTGRPCSCSGARRGGRRCPGRRRPRRHGPRGGPPIARQLDRAAARAPREAVADVVRVVPKIPLSASHRLSAASLRGARPYYPF